MDKSTDRKNNMERHLTNVGLKFYRVAGLTPNFMYIPDDIETTWRTAWCKTQTSEVIPPRHEVLSNEHSPLYNKTSIIAGLCGRGKNRNTPKASLQYFALRCDTLYLRGYIVGIRMHHVSSDSDEESYLFEHHDESLCNHHRGRRESAV